MHTAASQTHPTRWNALVAPLGAFGPFLNSICSRALCLACLGRAWWFGVARGARARSRCPRRAPGRMNWAWTGGRTRRGPVGAGEGPKAKYQIACPLIPTAAAQYCSSPDGRASRSERPAALLGVLADLLTSFTSTSREFRFSRA